MGHTLHGPLNFSSRRPVSDEIHEPQVEPIYTQIHIQSEFRATRISPNGPLSDHLGFNPSWARWALQVAEAVSHLYDKDIAHMHLKPAHIVTSKEEDAVSPEKTKQKSI